MKVERALAICQGNQVGVPHDLGGDLRLVEEHGYSAVASLGPAQLGEADYHRHDDVEMPEEALEQTDGEGGDIFVDDDWFLKKQPQSDPHEQCH